VNGIPTLLHTTLLEVVCPSSLTKIRIILFPFLLSLCVTLFTVHIKNKQFDLRFFHREREMDIAKKSKKLLHARLSISKF